jgi:uncharacterized protein (TIGR00255 family)
MIKSMTGFSKTEASLSGIKITTELKSLNGKGLELTFRMPRQIQHKEMELRDFFRNNISRGSVFVNIIIEIDEEVPSFSINKDIAIQCFEELQNLRKTLNLKEKITMENILAFSDKISHRENQFDEEVVLKLLSKTIQQGMKSLDVMKIKEGQNIAKDIIQRIKLAQENIKQIEEISSNRMPQERERLRNRIAQLFENDEIDEHRLQMEIVFLSDKLDVSEECVRLASHFKFFAEALQTSESVGRKINFLLQEMNREVNTIGSKANDSTISQLIVSTKEELERIREQIQNVE